MKPKSQWKPKLNWGTESQISQYIKYYNNMETKKKKINWKRIYEIIRDIIVAILTGNEITKL